MAFQLNGQPFNVDTAFTHGDIQYPANWFRLASAEDRAAIGITEVPDPEQYDQRFYWGPNNPKQLEDETVTPEAGDPYVQKGLKSQWIAQVKDTANKMLAPTDWYVIRKTETDTVIPANVITFRAGVKTECNRLETAIIGAEDVPALIAVVSAQNWPKL